MNDEEDRNRLVAFLKDKNMAIQTAIHNQPFMLVPPPKKEVKSKIKEQREQKLRVEDLKERVRILIETPLYLNSDLLENDLFAKNNGAKILQLIKKQMGVYTLLKGSQANQIKCLGQQLQDKQIGCSSIEVGLFSEQQLHNLAVTDEFKS